MGTYVVHWYSTGGQSIEVEADSMDDAIDASGQELPHSLCHQCASVADGFGDNWELSGVDTPDEGFVDLLEKR